MKISRFLKKIMKSELNNTNLNVLIITSSYPISDDDMRGTFIKKQVNCMVNKGYQMFVLTPHIPGASLIETNNMITIYRFPYFFPFSLQKLCGIGGMYFGFTRNLFGKLQIIPYMFMMILCSGLLIKKKKISLIHTHWIIPQGLAGSFWHFFFKIPHISTVHVLDVTIVNIFPLLKRCIKIVIKQTEVITVNSTFTKEQVQQFSSLQLPISVIPMGMDESRITIQEPGIFSQKCGHNILFVGRIIDWKGIETLIQAIGLISKEYPDITLRIVGEGPLKTHYQNVVGEMGLDCHIQFLGKVSNNTLNEEYKNADIFILPSKEEKGIVMEGLGVVLLEAMAHGVPVIGSRIGGITDIIEDEVTGRLFEPGNAKDLASKIQWTFYHPEKSMQYVKQGRLLISEKFSWDHVSQQFDAVYAKTLDRTQE